ncbi:hypothetical protein NV379_17585 [Paenibacillus sp. N1-5-1-14]|nr:hypothetical protein [Paenibacillus radicibacter]
MGVLINCKTCGGTVSSTAKMCPHCGERSPEPLADKIRYSLIALAGLGFGAIIAYLVYKIFA